MKKLAKSLDVLQILIKIYAHIFYHKEESYLIIKKLVHTIENYNIWMPIFKWCKLFAQYYPHSVYNLHIINGGQVYGESPNMKTRLEPHHGSTKLQNIM